jgi:hypothetical protein
MHTKEPWVFDQYGNANVNGETIRTMGFALSSCKTSIANARRIVACVNACAGLSIEMLENAALYPPVKSAFNGYITMKGERDELLSALKGLVAIAETEISDPENLSEMTHAKAAIISASQ